MHGTHVNTEVSKKQTTAIQNNNSSSPKAAAGNSDLASSETILLEQIRQQAHDATQQVEDIETLAGVIFEKLDAMGSMTPPQLEAHNAINCFVVAALRNAHLIKEANSHILALTRDALDAQKHETTAAATEAAKVVKLEPLRDRFDDRAMQKHSLLLGVAGNGLNRAFNTSYAIGVIADMLAANEVAKDCEEAVLLPNQEGGLLSAISVMANGLNGYLCDTASFFEARLEKEKGGAQ